jgi:NNP family nitrate/nitrite transporter-like MFS transporter
MLISAIPVALAPIAAGQYGFRAFVADAFFLGLAGSSFAVGVSFVSRWYPKAKQGSALGIYGIGNIGQSAAVFLGPVLAVVLAPSPAALGSGWAKVFYGTAVMLAVWAVVFALAARNPPAAARPANLAEMLHTLGHEPLAWALSAFYFLTFGGFVAFGIYLPSLLKDQFLLEPTDAGFRTAGFVVLATLTRPLGGWLSDRVGGARVLSFVLAGLVPFALLLAWPPEETGVNYVPVPFTLAALACAALLGFGNGAVFKLVPQYFPAQAGTITGLVGAMGGLGGFFPPLLLGYFSDHFHTIWPGFALLAATAFALYMLNRGVFLAREKQETARTEPRPSSQPG